MEYYIIGLVIAVMVIYAANYKQARGESAGIVNYFLYGIAGLIALFGVLLLLSAMLEPPPDVDMPRVNIASAMFVFLVAFLLVCSRPSSGVILIFPVLLPPTSHPPSLFPLLFPCYLCLYCSRSKRSSPRR